MGRTTMSLRVGARVYGLSIIILVASAAAKVVHDQPEKALQHRRPLKPEAIAPPYVPIFDADQKEYLEAHNDIRRSMGLPLLAWDAKLAASAHAWAYKRRHDCKVRRHSKTPYGESIFVMNYREFTPREVVQCWYNEKKLYDSKTMRCKCNPEGPGCECGHYLNIVWRTTARMGCSDAVYCDHQKGSYVVCQYDPPGLQKGINPFTGLPI